MAEKKPTPFSWGKLQPEKERSKEEIEEKVLSLLSQMTLDEKIKQMSGDTPRLKGIIEMIKAYNFTPIPAGKNERLDIPPIQFTDGPRGVVMYHSTCFPVTMARGATWDTELEEKVGEIIGIEARAQGANYFAGVCINLLRHPAWGRAQETYGEDPYHLGELGAALVRGVQKHIMACIKHFACNSMENARFKVDVGIDERSLHEVYLPHFKRCIDEGAASVMSAYNKVNGEYCGQNYMLLNQVLKKEWRFNGFVISDFGWGIRDCQKAVSSGMDIEMPFTKHFGKKLKKMVLHSKISEDIIDESVRRILRKKIEFAQIGETPEKYIPAIVSNPAHLHIAREVAQKSIVLLKNDTIRGETHSLLPLDKKKIKSIAVIGKLAIKENIGDKGSSKVRPNNIVTPLQGLEIELDGIVRIEYDDGKNLEKAKKIARDADVALIFAGYTHKDEGEYILYIGGDRNSLNLSPKDEELIKSIGQVQAKTAVIMIGGSAIITENWKDQVPSILMAWYSGMEGGNAIADILFGKAFPSGKLPCIFPKSEKQLPFFDKNADEIEYGYYHGYRLLDKKQEDAAFAFGFGLSYTSFQFSNLIVENQGISNTGIQKISVEITNTGSLEGQEVAQLYIGYKNSTIERHMKELKGFQRISLLPDETKKVAFDLPIKNLAYYDPNQKIWVVESIEYQVMVGNSSRKEDLLTGIFSVI